MLAGEHRVQTDHFDLALDGFAQENQDEVAGLIQDEHQDFGLSLFQLCQLFPEQRRAVIRTPAT